MMTPPARPLTPPHMHYLYNYSSIFVTVSVIMVFSLTLTLSSLASDEHCTFISDCNKKQPVYPLQGGVRLMGITSSTAVELCVLPLYSKYYFT